MKNDISSDEPINIQPSVKASVWSSLFGWSVTVALFFLCLSLVDRTEDISRDTEEALQKSEARVSKLERLLASYPSSSSIKESLQESEALVSELQALLASYPSYAAIKDNFRDNLALKQRFGDIEKLLINASSGLDLTEDVAKKIVSKSRDSYWTIPEIDEMQRESPLRFNRDLTGSMVNVIVPISDIRMDFSYDRFEEIDLALETAKMASDISKENLANFKQEYSNDYSYLLKELNISIKDFLFGFENNTKIRSINGDILINKASFEDFEILEIDNLFIISTTRDLNNDKNYEVINYKGKNIFLVKV